MILISHRGNLSGKQVYLENSPEYIDEAISLGFDVEIDIRLFDNNLYLGHDYPQYIVTKDWLLERTNKLWIHCKNYESISYFNHLSERFNYFWHQSDDLVLTSLGYIWAHPGKQPIENSIAVLPELLSDSIDNCLGVCSDYIVKFSG